MNREWAIWQPNFQVALRLEMIVIQSMFVLHLVVSPIPPLSWGSGFDILCCHHCCVRKLKPAYGACLTRFAVNSQFIQIITLGLRLTLIGAHHANRFSSFHDAAHIVVPPNSILPHEEGSRFDAKDVCQLKSWQWIVTLNRRCWIPWLERSIANNLISWCLSLRLHILWLEGSITSMSIGLHHAYPWCIPYCCLIKFTPPTHDGEVHLILYATCVRRHQWIHQCITKSYWQRYAPLKCIKS